MTTGREDIAKSLTSISNSDSYKPPLVSEVGIVNP